MSEQIYVIDQKSKSVLDDTRRKADAAAQIRTNQMPDSGQSSQQALAGKVLGLVIITDAGADADHWQWKFALRSSGGSLVAGAMGSDICGELVMCDGATGGVGTKGVLYYIHNETTGTALVLAPINDKGLHQGDIPQMITDEEKAWGPAQFGP